MISFVNSSGRLVYTNPEWERTLGWTSAEVQQVDILAGLFPDPGQRQRMQELMEQHPDSRWHDFQPRTHDGKVIEVTWADFPLSDGSSIKVGIDVTERKQAEAERARLQAATEDALARLRAIQSITDAAIGRMPLDDLLRELAGRLRGTLKTDGAAVVLLDERNNLTVRAVDGRPSPPPGTRIPLSSPIWTRLAADPRPVVIEDYTLEATPEFREWSAKYIGFVRSAMGAPLIVEERLIGAVVAYSLESRRFAQDELDLLRVVADRVAPAIERGRLLESLRAGRERLEALSRRLLSVQEEERRRLAIELHDELGQILTAVKINLESVPAQLRHAVDSVDRAMETTRDLALDLRPAMLDDLGLAAALR